VLDLIVHTLDVNALLQRVDVNALLDRVDVSALVQRALRRKHPAPAGPPGLPGLLNGRVGP
jgi:hypothetical protein